MQRDLNLKFTSQPFLKELLEGGFKRRKTGISQAQNVVPAEE